MLKKGANNGADTFNYSTVNGTSAEYCFFKNN